MYMAQIALKVTPEFARELSELMHERQLARSPRQFVWRCTKPWVRPGERVEVLLGCEDWPLEGPRIGGHGFGAMRTFGRKVRVVLPAR